MNWFRKAASRRLAGFKLLDRAAAGLALAALLAACGQSGAGPRPPLVGATAPPVGDRLGTLRPQTLEPGQCGLFLWSRTTPPRLVLFSDGIAGTAQLTIDGETRRFERSRSSGEPFYGQFPKQEFRSGDLAFALSLEADTEAGIVNGMKISRGLLRLEDGSGGYAAVPVAGMVACQAS